MFGVTIGGANAAGAYVNPTTITATTPAHAAGAVNVVITNNDGQSITGTNAYTYTAGPTFTSITPTSGPTAGGTPVTITGSNFVDVGLFGVTIGGANAAGAYVNPTTITATTPAHAAGAVNVVITNNDGQIYNRDERIYLYCRSYVHQHHSNFWSDSRWNSGYDHRFKLC